MLVFVAKNLLWRRTSAADGLLARSAGPYNPTLQKSRQSRLQFGLASRQNWAGAPPVIPHSKKDVPPRATRARDLPLPAIYGSAPIYPVAGADRTEGAEIARLEGIGRKLAPRDQSRPQLCYWMLPSRPMPTGQGDGLARFSLPAGPIAGGRLPQKPLRGTCRESRNSRLSVNKGAT